jgi:hypothetical protein
MANEFYITAGLPAIDYNDIGSVGTNAFFITAGLVANDYTPPEEDTSMLLFVGDTMGGNASSMMG